MELGYCPQIIFRAYDDNGKPLSGGLVQTFYAGSSIPEPTYKDFSGAPWSTTFNLNASGEARILLDKAKAYKFIISNADGSNPQVYDNISITEGVLEVGGGTLNLQQVTDNGNVTTNGMEIGGQLKLGTQQINNAPTKVLGIDPLGNVVETDPSVFLSTTAGILDRIFFTGDTQVLTSGTYYKTSGTSKGTVPLVTQTVSPNDNQKLYFAQDLISEQVTGAPKNFPKGAYSGQLSVLGTSISAGQQQKFTIEVYAADSNGVPYNSGVSGAPTGDLGFQVISILDSGNVTLASGEESLVLVSGFLTDDYSLAIGSRVRLHVSGEKIGIIGGAINLSVFYGQNANSYLDVPASITSNMVENLSTVLGANVTNALDWLNTNKEPTITAGTSAQYWDGTKTWHDFASTTRSVTMGGGFTLVNSPITSIDSVLSAFGKTQGQINALGTSLGNYIAKDGSTTTTATIPFAVGISVTGRNADASAIRIPDGAWIRPQTAGDAIYILNGSSPSTSSGLWASGDTVHLRSTLAGSTTNAPYWYLSGSDWSRLTTYGQGWGMQEKDTTNPTYTRSYIQGYQEVIQAGTQSATGVPIGSWGINPNEFNYLHTGYHKWDGGVSGSTAKYQFGGGSLDISNDIILKNNSYIKPTTTLDAIYISSGGNAFTRTLSLSNAQTSLYFDANNSITITSSGMNLSKTGAGASLNLNMNGGSGANVLVMTDAGIRLNPRSGGNAQLQWGASNVPPTGTQAYLLAVDASGNIIQGTASGNFVTKSGHTQITMPWSIGDAATFNASNYGYYIDNAYGNYIKGQTIIEQATSSGLILYRPVTSGDICLEYDAWDLVGTRVAYAQVCGRVVSNAVGSQTGAIALEAYTAGVKSDIAVFQSSGIQFNSALSGTSASFSSTLAVTGRTILNSSSALESWYTSDSAMGIGSYYRLSGLGGAFAFTANAYRNTSGTWTNLDAGVIASQYVAYNGAHEFYTGSSATNGTASNFAVSFKINADKSVRLYGQMLGSDGTSGAPSYSFSTEPTLGFWRSAAGVVTLQGALTTTGKISVPSAIAGSAYLNIGAFSATVTSPVDGDIWKSAADVLSIRNGANTRTFALNEVVSTFSAVKTFSATPVISSTTASTTAGAIYKRTNYGHVGYEAGMAQEFMSCVYTAPVGTALTNSVTETDVNGGTAAFGTRTLSATVMQLGVWITVKARVKMTNTAANTLTLRLRWSTTAGTILATAVVTRVNAAAEVFDVIFRGVASAAPSATSATSWSAEIGGNSSVAAASSTTSSEATLATNAATPLILTAQWTSALATSSVQILNSEINLD